MCTSNGKKLRLGLISVISLFTIVSCGGGSSPLPNPSTQDKPVLTLLSDMNTTAKPLSSQVGHITEFNNLLYFGAISETLGSELWSYDGSQLELFADINSGEGSSGPRDLKVLNGYLYFSANDPVNGFELRRTDGTNIELVADISPGVSSSNPHSLQASNGFIYFIANKNGSGDRLWRTDGSVTEPVVGTENITIDYALTSITFNNKFYFVGDLNNTGSDSIWRTDGTSTELFSQTALTEDITVNRSNISFISYANSLYFNGSTADSGFELMRTDGTSIEMFQDINIGSGDSNPVDFIEYSGQLYFTAADSTSGTELWRTNGTVVEQVADIEPGATSSRPEFKVISNNQLFFRATTSTNGLELWRTDGVETVQVADINSGTAGSVPRYFASYNNLLYFVADDGINGAEIWRADSSSAVLFADIDNGLLPRGSAGYGLFVFNNELYFLADDGVNARELWKTDGLTTELAFQTNSTIATDYTSFSSFLYHDNDLYITIPKQPDVENKYDIWRTTDQGLIHIAEASSSSLVNYNGDIHYAYYDDVTQSSQLWRVTANGSELVTTILAARDVRPSDFIVYNNGLYFSATGENGRELWRYNGTSASEFSDIDPGSLSSSPSEFHIYNNELYFLASQSATGKEIWYTDGTNVSLLQDINPGSASSVRYTTSGAQRFTNFNGMMYFSANDGVNGDELWQTDGTSTSLVININPAQTNALPSNFKPQIAGSWMYFPAFITDQGSQIWRTNGRTTEALGSNVLGFTSVSVSANITFNNQFYFTAYDSSNVSYLFRIDDSMTTAERVDQAIPGIGDLSQLNLFEHNNELLIMGRSVALDNELWRVNGAEIENLSNFSNNSIFAGFLNHISAGNRLYLVANDGSTGNELWYLDF